MEVYIIEENKYKVWISLIKNLGIKRYTALIRKFKTIEGIWNASKNDLLKVEGIGKRLAEVLVDSNIREYVKRHMDFMNNNKIGIISIEEYSYPKLLKEIYDPPICLYIKGNINILNNESIAIIGCREASDYGIKVANDFAYNISKKDINIISGLARGIDSSAHLGAIRDNRKTIAVVGNGLDSIYPKENFRLVQDILDSRGSIISEYPLGTPPKKQNFPARNRIISGMSRKILVVEARKKSGTLITVDFALDQGRDVLVIPGNIDSNNSIGTNELIKQGARLVTNWEECIEDIKKNE